MAATLDRTAATLMTVLKDNFGDLAKAIPTTNFSETMTPGRKLTNVLLLPYEPVDEDLATRPPINSIKGGIKPDEDELIQIWIWDAISEKWIQFLPKKWIWGVWRDGPKKSIYLMMNGQEFGLMKVYESQMLPLR